MQYKIVGWADNIGLYILGYYINTMKTETFPTFVYSSQHKIAISKYVNKIELYTIL